MHPKLEPGKSTRAPPVLCVYNVTPAPSKDCLEITHRNPVNLDYIRGSVTVRLLCVGWDGQKSGAKPSKCANVRIAGGKSEDELTADFQCDCGDPQSAGENRELSISETLSRSSKTHPRPVEFPNHWKWERRASDDEFVQAAPTRRSRHRNSDRFTLAVQWPPVAGIYLVVRPSLRGTQWDHTLVLRDHESQNNVVLICLGYAISVGAAIMHWLPKFSTSSPLCSFFKTAEQQNTEQWTVTGSNQVGQIAGQRLPEVGENRRKESAFMNGITVQARDQDNGDYPPRCWTMYHRL
ncbi:hypothetical protein BJ322DRAFT_1016995 [Thelephora terrestris]|uniref:Uncharacterized protein n=1 Tax=Thelephora terrestris TaxID=56493 RepID=A0A9P6HZH3_9AGAM|nr:hypothetical protein BJ322DRAFT_1016995 [Thelephora terrestris]